MSSNIRIASFISSLLALLLLLSGPPASASPASALGPQLPVVEARDGFVGRLQVSPPNGPAGTTVTITADRLPANEDFALAWRTVVGAWNVSVGEYHGREFKVVAYEIGKFSSSSAGSLTATFVAPEDFGFVHDIVLQQRDRLLTQAAFSLDMTVKISPENGPPGTPITVEVQGIGWRPLFNSWHLLYDNRFTGWISSVTTHGSAKFVIPASGNPGPHVLEILHGEFTFPYRNMQQNPEPDRPRWAIPFLVTDASPMLPMPAERQVQTRLKMPLSAGDLVARPAFAAVGDEVTVSAAAVAPNQSHELNWVTLTGNRVGGGGWEEAVRAVASARSNGAGEVQFRFAVPDDLGGPHPLFLATDAGNEIGSLLVVPKALPLDVTRGPVGTTFTVHLKGVGWTETANIYHVVYDNGYIGYACGFNSQGDVEIFLKATGDPGWHFIDLYPGIYKGTERRPNNYAIPQLTYADDHPGEDLPAFHFAFEVVKQTAGTVSAP
jgi:hypothetical protein